MNLSRIFGIEANIFRVQVGGPVSCLSWSHSNLEIDLGQLCSFDRAADRSRIERQRFPLVEQGYAIDLQRRKLGSYRHSGVTSCRDDSPPVGIAASNRGLH